MPASDPGTRTITATCGSAGDDTADSRFFPLLLPHWNSTAAVVRRIDCPCNRHDFGCRDGGVELYWDGSYLTTTDSGSFDEALTVPGDAQAGQYTVRATCVDDPDIVEDAQFTVKADVMTGPRLPRSRSRWIRAAGRGRRRDSDRCRLLCDNNSRQVHWTSAVTRSKRVRGRRRRIPHDVRSSGWTPPPARSHCTPLRRRFGHPNRVVHRERQPGHPDDHDTPDNRIQQPNDSVIVFIVLLVLAAW